MDDEASVIAAGKFAGVTIASLSDDDLREAQLAAVVARDPMLAEIRAERRRRWRATHRGDRFTRRQRSRYAKRWECRYRRTSRMADIETGACR